MSKATYGGQAVIEGVMMAGPKGKAIAVRNEDGDIIYKIVDKPRASEKNSKLKWPIVRGLVSFGSSMVSGVKDLTWSAAQAGETEDDKLSTWDIILAVGGAFIFAILFFVALPVFAGTFIHPYVGDFGRSLFEGVLRLALFLGYVLAISRMNDIKRIFAYHGAEHKTINAYEAGVELNPENVRHYSRIHTRCGTSFILMAMLVMIIVFTFIGQTDALHRSIIKIILLPVIAGISYELYRLPLLYPNNKLIKVLVAPGLAMQRLTTREPDAGMLEVAIAALKAVPGFGAEAAETAVESGVAAQMVKGPVELTVEQPTIVMPAARAKQPQPEPEAPAGFVEPEVTAALGPAPAAEPAKPAEPAETAQSAEPAEPEAPRQERGAAAVAAVSAAVAGTVAKVKQKLSAWQQQRQQQQEQRAAEKARLAEQAAAQAAEQAEREAQQAAEQAEREAQQAAEQAEREAQQAAEQAELEAKQAAEQAELEAKQAAEQAEREAAERAAAEKEAEIALAARQQAAAIAQARLEAERQQAELEAQQAAEQAEREAAEQAERQRQEEQNAVVEEMLAAAAAKTEEEPQLLPSDILAKQFREAEQKLNLTVPAAPVAAEAAAADEVKDEPPAAKPKARAPKKDQPSAAKPKARPSKKTAPAAETAEPAPAADDIVEPAAPKKAAPKKTAPKKSGAASGGKKESGNKSGNTKNSGAKKSGKASAAKPKADTSAKKEEN